MWSIFHSLQQWSEELINGNKLTWVKCACIPLHTWGDECFSKIISMLGTFVKVDKEMLVMEHMDNAKI